MANPENPAMNADQGTGLDSLQEFWLAHAGPKHILASHDTV
jgi:hypothetical protein